MSASESKRPWGSDPYSLASIRSAFRSPHCNPTLLQWPNLMQAARALLREVDSRDAEIARLNGEIAKFFATAGYR